MPYYTFGKLLEVIEEGKIYRNDAEVFGGETLTLFLQDGEVKALEYPDRAFPITAELLADPSFREVTFYKNQSHRVVIILGNDPMMVSITAIVSLENCFEPDENVIIDMALAEVSQLLGHKPKYLDILVQEIKSEEHEEQIEQMLLADRAKNLYAAVAEWV